VNVARTILDREDLAGLGHVGQDRVVARDLAVVRIEAPLRPGHLQTGRYHRAVHVQRHPAAAEPSQRLAHQLRVQLAESPHTAVGELLQPAAQRALVGQPPQPGQAAHQGIASNVVDMAQPASSDPQQPEQQANHRHERVVARKGVLRERPAHPAVKIERPQEAIQQLEARVRRQRLPGELDLQIVVDTDLTTALS